MYTYTHMKSLTFYHIDIYSDDFCLFPGPFWETIRKQADSYLPLSLSL